MKRIIIAVAALSLAACATNYDAYAKAQESIVKAQSDAETARLVALARIAETGDASTRIAAVMTLAFTGNRGGTMQMAAPQNMALEWAKVLMNPLVSLYGINRNTTVQLANIEAETAQYGATLGTLGAISIKGMEEAGTVVFPPVYTVPMGSAPAAAAAPAAPVAPVTATTPAATP
jgi:hypothetical protein